MPCMFCNLYLGVLPYDLGLQNIQKGGKRDLLRFRDFVFSDDDSIDGLIEALDITNSVSCNQ